MLFLTSGQTRLERGWGRRERVRSAQLTRDPSRQQQEADPSSVWGIAQGQKTLKPSGVGVSAGRALGHSQALDPGVWWSLDKRGAPTYTLRSKREELESKEVQGEGHSVGAAISGAARRPPSMLYSPQSGLCSGHRAFSRQVAIAQAGLGHPWPAGQAGGGSSSRQTLSLAGWAGQTPGVGS